MLLMSRSRPASPPVFATLVYVRGSHRCSAGACSLEPYHSKEPHLTAKTSKKQITDCCECTCCDALYMHSFAQQRGSLSHDETWSVASQHCTVNTTCVQTEGKNLSAHLDLCVSSVAHKISQDRLRIVTPLRRRMPCGTSDR